MFVIAPPLRSEAARPEDLLKVRALLLLFLLPMAACHGVWIHPSFKNEVKELETEHYRIVTDATAGSLSAIASACEDMHRELEALLPRGASSAALASSASSATHAASDSASSARPVPAQPPENVPPEDKRVVFVFGDPASFEKFLGAHLFAQERAIGFYCDLGRECALMWNDPPGPEDFRVLRHELVHQHLAARLEGQLPGWFEEGLAERLALAPLAAAPQGSATQATDAGAIGLKPWLGGWRSYVSHRESVDALFAALSLRHQQVSWDPDDRNGPTQAIDPPLWGDGEGGYVLHLAFVNFLEAIGEGLPGAIGSALAIARDGGDGALDLSHRFATVGVLEACFHAYVGSRGRRALVAEAGITDPLLKDAAFEALGHDLDRELNDASINCPYLPPPLGSVSESPIP